MTLVIIAAEIDISIGPAVAFTGVVLAIATSEWHTGMALGVIITLLVGAACGAFAGFLRAQFNMPSFIATLGLWSVMRGLAEYLTNGIPMQLPDSSFINAMAGTVLGIPVPAIVMVVLFGVFYLILQKTSYGRSVVAIGGNPVAAGLAGIPVKRIRIMLFATTGLLSAVAGILLAARLLSGNGDSATGLEFNVIAAVVVGGTVLSGGRGSMVGTFLGVAFITIIGDGLVLLGVNSFLQEVAQGVIVVLAVLTNQVAGQRRGPTSRRKKPLGLSLTSE